MAKYHPKYHGHLLEVIGELGKAIPGPMRGFSQLHKSAVADGALETKTKELISLGIAITSHCDGCISFHVHDALKSGATHEEIVETIGVAILMGGGPALMYGCEAYEALGQFEAVEA